MPPAQPPPASQRPVATVPRWQRELTQSWLKRNALSRLLWPVSLVYGALVAFRAWRFRTGRIASERMPVPVVMVGNVVVGGAGKTPTTMAIVRHLQAQGHRPGVVSRGYGRQTARTAPSHSNPPTHPNGTPSSRRQEPTTDVVHVRADTPAHVAGDEPLLIFHATQVPVVVASQRVLAARALLAAHPNTTVLVCDDGLQHLSLHADVSVAVFDERGVGNGWLLPAGLLREPWPWQKGNGSNTDHSPSRAHGCGPARTVHIVLQAQADGALAAHQAPLACPAHAQHAWAHKHLDTHAVNAAGMRLPLTELTQDRRQTWAACAGIANPTVFFDMLRQAGVALERTWPLSDHQDFQGIFESELLNGSKRWGLFCTEKDAVKIFPLLRAAHAHNGRSGDQDPEGAHRPNPLHQVWAVPLVFSPEPAFFQALDHRLSLFDGHQTA